MPKVAKRTGDISDFLVAVAEDERNEEDSLTIPLGGDDLYRAAIYQRNEEILQTLIKSFSEDTYTYLSENELQNKKYSFVLGASQCGHTAITLGYPPMNALFDTAAYIRRCDVMERPEEINALYEEMLFDFRDKIKERSMEQQQLLQQFVEMYVNRYINKPFTIRELSRAAGYSPAYFSALYKKETGENVTEYIRRTRIDAAKNLLKSTNYPCTWIANTLAFSTPSHFAALFRRYTGMTPREYRAQNHQT